MSDRTATYLSDLLREVNEEIVEARALQAQFPRLPLTNESYAPRPINQLSLALVSIVAPPVHCLSTTFPNHRFVYERAYGR